MISPAFLNPYVGMAAIVVVCVAAGVGYAKGLTHGLDRLAQFKVEVAEANTKVAEANRIKIELAEQNTRDVATLYARYASDIARDYSSRLVGLRKHSGDCATMPAVARPSGIANGVSENAGSTQTSPAPSEYELVCARLEADCADTTGKLVFLQRWVKEVCR